MTTPMTSDSEGVVSDCHNALMVVRGGSEGTNHYECTECGQACNWRQIAQSEAPSVDDELEKILDRLAVRMYSEGQLDKPSLMGRQVAIVNINEAKSKINRLILEASPNTDNIRDWVNKGLESTNSDVWYRCLQMINDELSNNLSKGAGK